VNVSFEWFEFSGICARKRARSFILNTVPTGRTASVHCSCGEWWVWRRHLRTSEGGDWGTGGTIGLGFHQPAAVVVYSLKNFFQFWTPSMPVVFDRFFTVLFSRFFPSLVNCNAVYLGLSTSDQLNWTFELNNLCRASLHCTIDHNQQEWHTCLLALSTLK